MATLEKEFERIMFEAELSCDAEYWKTAKAYSKEIACLTTGDLIKFRDPVAYIARYFKVQQRIDQAQKR